MTDTTAHMRLLDALVDYYESSSVQVIITGTSVELSKNDYSLVLNLYEWSCWYSSGKSIEDQWTNRTDEERYFILTGVTPSEWNNIFGIETDASQT